MSEPLREAADDLDACAAVYRDLTRWAKVASLMNFVSIFFIGGWLALVIHDVDGWRPYAISSGGLLLMGAGMLVYTVIAERRHKKTCPVPHHP